MTFKLHLVAFTVSRGASLTFWLIMCQLTLFLNIKLTSFKDLRQLKIYIIIYFLNDCLRLLTDSGMVDRDRWTDALGSSLCIQLLVHAWQTVMLVLVSRSCCNKWLWMWWLETTNILSSVRQKWMDLIGLTSRYDQGCIVFFWEVFGKNLVFCS